MDSSEEDELSRYVEVDWNLWVPLLELLTSPSFTKASTGSTPEDLDDRRQPVKGRTIFLAKRLQKLCFAYKLEQVAEVLEVLTSGMYPADQLILKALPLPRDCRQKGDGA